ncbi:hypothetical protein ECZU38_19660 [Escherichia coli]|nr:hypothetical protein ECZU38_19660 [Escherichia coli]
MNSGNGAAGHVIDEVEKRFAAAGVPVTFIKVHHQPDGHFPNGIPNPLLPECRRDTADAVCEHQADMGIAFDGDFDRCFLFDDEASFIEGITLSACWLRRSCRSSRERKSFTTRA